MNRAIVDPDQLRHFAAQLKLFADEVRNRGTVLTAAMNELEQTWRDDQQRKFKDEFEVELRSLARIVQSAERHVPYLVQKASQIDAYLGR